MVLVQRKVLIVAGPVVTVLVVVSLAYFGGQWLWGELAAYIRPDTATERKDLVSIFVIIAAGIAGALTALAALGNLYVSRTNLQNARNTFEYQRGLDRQRDQAEALQTYLGKIGELLLDKDRSLRLVGPEHEARTVARAQTLAVLERLDASHKRDLIDFLQKAKLIKANATIIDLVGANLSGADLSGADLSGADLSGADLSGADLRGANGVTRVMLASATSFEGATMPNE
jgi:uncharacterized protein YjbI with pentapeptide repeats